VENDFFEKLSKLVEAESIKRQELMKKHTTFKIGGPADCYICPHTVEEVASIVALCKEENIPYYIIGNGSNLLIGDKGYRGVIIHIYNNFNAISVEDNKIYTQAGALLSEIAKVAARNNLAGFEFASGIPGTIGGAAVMNAGAYGGEMKDVLFSVTVLNGDGEIVIIPSEELELGYRTSIIAKNGYIVLNAIIELKQGKQSEIEEVMNELKEKRTEKQPLEYGSAGSTFKRPEGYFAGKLIMDSNLRGVCIGDAQVSEKHCGFVINKNQATAAEVVALMEHIANTVYENFQVKLEPEIKMLGEF
jgi:UDP-N-acetylenolpyruvoylglucosamine reductase